MTRTALGPPRRPARKRFGQHFLEAAWVQKVVDAIRPQPDDRFLEIGPGRGALTAALASRCRSIVAVEIDRDLAADLADTAPPNVRVVAGDFLETPLHEWREHPHAYRVAANLPYNVGTPILFRLLALAREGVLTDAVLMLQREVAARLVVRPPHRNWGPLGVFAQLQADVERVLTLPPGAFRPPPRVHSAVVRLRFREDAVAVGDYARFVHLVRGLFMHRRKTLANALREMEPGTVSRAERYPVALSVERALADAHLDGKRRPETLQLAELARLSQSHTSV